MKNDENNINFRDLVVGVDDKIPLKDEMYIPINFDNAATTPPFRAVVDELRNFAPFYSSVHRGMGYKADLSSKYYDLTREKIASFVGADKNNDAIIYVKNTTEAINKLSYKLCTNKKTIILSSDMEHHSNDLPWRNKFFVDYISINENGSLSIRDLEMKLKKYNKRVRLVTVTGASNVTGIRNSIYDLAELSHKYGAKIFVDCAQLIPHASFDMIPYGNNSHIDFIAFSGHKMYAPFGIGVLIGNKSLLNNKEPEYKGGGTVKIVTHNYISWEDTPLRDEPGTPNVMGVIALSTALDVINSIGIKNIEAYEHKLTEYALKKLVKIPDIQLYTNDINSSNRIGIIPFNINGISHYTTAKALALNGIAVRNGCFCAQPYVQKLLKLTKQDLAYYIKNPTSERPGMVRISFGLYNTFDEIDEFCKVLCDIIKHKDFYNKNINK